MRARWRAHHADDVFDARWWARRKSAFAHPTIHRRAHRGIHEEVTMLELFILAAGMTAGYAASVYSWPWIRAQAIGASAEINQLRARAKALEDNIKGAL
jgi:hypothetical protein